MGDKEGDEDKVIGIAVADIPKGSPLMKSTKPPAGDAIKPPTKSSDKGGVQVDKSLMEDQEEVKIWQVLVVVRCFLL